MDPLYQETHLYCDIRRVIIHGNFLYTVLPEKPTQADLIHHVKYLTRTAQCKGHVAEQKGIRQCSLPEHLNEIADKLAKRALVNAIAGGGVIYGEFPLESIKINISGVRFRSSP